MSSKSHVSLEQKVCPICGNKHDVGVLLDKRLRNSLEPTTVTGWGHCPECQGKIDEGYVALVGAEAPKHGDTLKLEDAHRTGVILFVRRSAFADIFNMPLEDGRVMAFIDPEAIAKISKMVGE